MEFVEINKALIGAKEICTFALPADVKWEISEYYRKKFGRHMIILDAEEFIDAIREIGCDYELEEALKQTYLNGNIVGVATWSEFFMSYYIVLLPGGTLI